MVQVVLRRDLQRGHSFGNAVDRRNLGGDELVILAAVPRQGDVNERITSAMRNQVAAGEELLPRAGHVDPQLLPPGVDRQADDFERAPANDLHQTRAARKARIRRHASSSASKSLAKQKRSIFRPASETKNAEPGTEATRAFSSSDRAASLSSRNSSGIRASM